jgi:predicted DNA-binding protein
LNQQQPEEPTTISGRPITSPVAFRLILSDYERLQKRAAMEGKTVAALVQEWVIERLTRGVKDA